MKTEKSDFRFGKSATVVEIGAEWLKIVKAESLNRNPAISSVHLRRIEEGGSSLATMITGILGSSRANATPVIACLPRQMVNVRMLELPSTDPKEIADMIDLQVAKQTPHSRDEIMFDYRIVGSRHEGYTRAMLVIVQRALVRQRFLALEEAGLHVAKVSVSTEGLLSWYLLNRSAEHLSSETAVILDVDSSSSDLAIVAGDELVFNRSMLIGANHLRSDSGEWTGKVIQEVRHSLEMYRSETPGGKISRILLTGAGPNIKGFSEQLHRACDIEVLNCGPVKNIEVRSQVSVLDDPVNASVSITPLVGCVLAPQALELDLTPDAVRVRETLKRNARHLTLLGIQVMAVLALCSVLTVDRGYVKAERLARLNAKLARTSLDVDALNQMQAKTQLVAQRLDSKYAPVVILRELQSLMPESIYLTSIQIGPAKQIAVRGVAEATSDVYGYVNVLEASALFKSVNASTSRKEFEITGSLEM
jgi:Tfp pilus assembly PilM family ATPase/Tfp pilus assembly protein PilN